MKRPFGLRPRLPLSLLLMVCVSACQMPPGPGTYPPAAGKLGTVTRIVGTGQVQINQRRVFEGAPMYSGDYIQTFADAQATLELARGGKVLFDANTDPFLEWVKSATCKLRILINVGSILVDTPCETVAETGSGAVVETLGTSFHLTVRRQWSEVTVLQGEMVIRSDVGGSVVVPAGYQCRAVRGRPAPDPLPVDTLPVTAWGCRLDRRLCPGGESPPRRVTVPDLRGRSLDEARRILERQGLRLGRLEERPTGQRSAEGRVADHSPAPGRRVPAGTPVALGLWRYGQVHREMPMLLNRPFGEAQRMLKAAGIGLARVTELKSGNPDLHGRVARQSPRPGARLEPGIRVVLEVYRYERRPAPLAQVPRVVGLPIDKARALLERAGLKANQVALQPPPSRAQNGMVFRQRPDAGTGLAPGSAVDLWIYQTLIFSPPVMRLPQAQPLE